MTLIVLFVMAAWGPIIPFHRFQFRVVMVVGLTKNVSKRLRIQLDQILHVFCVGMMTNSDLLWKAMEYIFPPGK